MSSVKIDHIAVKSSNIDKSIFWYCENLDAELLYKDSTWAMIRCGEIKIALVKGNLHPPHIAFRVDSESDFPCKHSEIKEHRDKSRYHYGKDPDGNSIEWVLYVPSE